MSETTPIIYFRVDKKTNKFYSVFVNAVAVTADYIQINRDGKPYMLTSKYDLTDANIRFGNYLLMFAYSPKGWFNKQGKFAELYPLPLNRSFFRPSDLKVEYSAISAELKEKIIQNNEILQALIREADKMKQELLDLIDDKKALLTQKLAPVENQSMTLIPAAVNRLGQKEKFSRKTVKIMSKKPSSKAIENFMKK